MTKTYKSNILAAVHENMQNAYDIGVIDQKTMRRFDESCLTKVLPLSPEDITAVLEYATKQADYSI